MKRNDFRCLLRMTSILVLISLHLPLNSQRIIDILSDPGNYTGKRVCLKGRAVQCLDEERSIDTLLFYFSDDSGGVIPARVSSSAPLVLFAEMQLCGNLVQEGDMGPVLIVKNPKDPTDSNRDAKHFGLNEMPSKSVPIPKAPMNSDPEPPINTLARIMGGEGRFSSALLSQLGTRLLQVLHPTCIHESTGIQSSDNQTMRFVTRYSGWLKTHTLIWEVALGGPVLVRDFRFVSDTSPVPSAHLVNQAKDMVIHLIHQYLSN